MKSFIYAAVLMLGLTLPATAQSSLSQGQLNFQYHEPIPPGGDLSASRAAILSDAEKDCEAAQKAFGLTCAINNIQFSGPGTGFNSEIRRRQTQCPLVSTCS